MQSNLTQNNYAHQKSLSPYTQTAVRFLFYCHVIKKFKVKVFCQHRDTKTFIHIVSQVHIHKYCKKRKLTNIVTCHIRHKNCMCLVLFTRISGNTIGQKRKFTAQTHTTVLTVPFVFEKYFYRYNFQKVLGFKVANKYLMYFCQIKQ